MSVFKEACAYLGMSSLLIVQGAIAPAQAQQNYPLTCRGGGI